MNFNTVKTQIDTLAKKATTTSDQEGSASLRFSQAALNLAHALAVMLDNKRGES